MDRHEILDGLRQAVLAYRVEDGTRLAGVALAAGLSPLDAIDGGLSPGIKVVGEKFRAMEIFLPELMLAAKVFLESMKVLEPAILALGEARPRRGVAVIGTVKGDVHSIGKDLFGTLLQVAGFEVHNLGINVHPSRFVEKAEETGADIVGLSALMTTTMPGMREVVEFLDARQLPKRPAVLVGGGPVTAAWAQTVGADGHGRTAQDGVDLALTLVAKRRSGGT